VKLKVYQIGLTSIGRYGFEKLVDLDRNFSEVDVELIGACEKDFEKLENAEKFAKANDIEIESFKNVDEMYKHAKKQEEKVMIYDSGPADTHPDHIYRSMKNGFFHLAKKPPSMNRGEHIREKKLAEDNHVMWKTDFIERENPVVKKMLEKIEEGAIDKIEVYRESSVGIEKLIKPIDMMDVEGGDIFDKMINEVYVLDLLEEAGNDIELELVDASTRYFMPKELGSDKVLSMRNGYTESIKHDSATGMTEAELKSGNIDIELHSSWLGLGKKARSRAKKIKEDTGFEVFDRRFSELDETAYMNEEACFVIIEGEKRLVGDLLNRKLFDLDECEEIDLDFYIHDQLYRVIEKAVLNAAGKEKDKIGEKETDVFMNALFDIKAEVSSGEPGKEMKKANKKAESLIVEDGKIIEAEESETLAG